MVREYFRGYLRLGEAYERGLVLETLTWRASSDWGERLGFDAIRLRDVNRRAVDFLLGLREREAGSTVVVSGCIGPRGDAYTDLGSMDADAAEAYHRPQVEALTDAGADLVTALTLTNPTEAIGVVRAAQACHVPVVISFTVETDGVAARRHRARRGGGRGRRRHRCGAELLHGELRASRPLRRGARSR